MCPTNERNPFDRVTDHNIILVIFVRAALRFRVKQTTE